MTTKKIGAVKPGIPLKNTDLTADSKHMRAALKAYGIEIPPRSNDADLVAMLHAFHQKKFAEGEAALDCTNCLEQSIEAADACPFCGDSGVEGVDGEPVDADEVEPIEAPLPAASDEVIDLMRAPAPANDTVDEPVKPKKGKGKLALATTTPAVPMRSIEELQLQLRESETRISVLEQDFKGNAYDLGLEYERVQNNELWKSAGFTSFGQWIEKTATVSRAYAYRLATIAREFDRETFMKHGASKLGAILLTDNSGTREEAIAAADAGATVQQIKRKVKGEKAEATKATPKEAPKKSATITLLAKLNNKSVSYPFKNGETGRVLKMYREGAYAEIPISDDVVQRAVPEFDRDGQIVGIKIAFAKVEA